MSMYAIRQTGEKVFEVANFEDHKEPDKIYIIRDGRCNCDGSMRSNKPCRHREMLTDWESSGKSFVGAFYEKETDQVYRPIPLDGPVDISKALEPEPSPPRSPPPSQQSTKIRSRAVKLRGR